MNPRLRRGLRSTVLALSLGGVAFDAGSGWRLWYPYGVVMAAGRTHEQVLSDLRPRLQPGLRASVQAAGLAYPPPKLVLVGLKHERVLEVWAPVDAAWRRLRAYQVLAASGGPGPKLREGDLQVPEGVYRVTVFNPNSSYHLSVRVDYPNSDDLVAARADGRERLGGDIYIHGKAVSIGCLALGDDAIEELYVLLADVGLAHVSLLLAPSANPLPAHDAPAWLAQRYERLRAELLRVRASSTR
jgi:L,D-transpeptidase catalytic domain